MTDSMQKRATERIEVEVPVHLETGSGISRNVSLSGIYFLTDQTFEEGKRFRFTIEFEFAIPGRPIHLDCTAQVLRMEHQGEKLGIAARIDDLTYLREGEDAAAELAAGNCKLH